MTTILAIPLATHPAAAIPGNGVDSPANIWTPYGPNSGPGGVQKILYQYYASETSEFQQFELGKIDLTDWELPPAKYASYDANQDFLLTPNQGQFGDYGMYFNALSSRFSSFPSDTGQAAGPIWGCNWNTGTVGTTSLQTYSTACGKDMRDAFEHLIDRPTFTNNFGGLGPLACDSPPAKTPTCVSLAQQCAWDTLFTSCIDAFRIAPNPSGFAAPGSPDFCAAADHMIAAGIATGKTSGTCVLTGVNAGVFSSPLRAMIRNNDPRRLAMGNGWMNAANQLFGGQAVVPTYGNINQIGHPIVFCDPPICPVDDWDMYTFGYLLGTPFPDQLYGLFNSLFASNYCGTGPQAGNPGNPIFACTTAIDSATFAAAQTADIPTFNAATLNSFDQLGKAAVDIPVFTPAIRIAALRTVGGLVNVKGVAYNSAQDLFFAHKCGTLTSDASSNCRSTPSNSLYAFGGNGNPSTLRYGQASTTASLNIWGAQTVWDFQVLGEIYDTLFTGNPDNPGQVFCNMCEHFTKVVDGAGNTHFNVELRPDVFWQDGVPLTAFDVKFSFLNFRDNPVTASGSLPGLLLDVKVVDNYNLDIVWTGQSLSYPVFMEQTIIPRHIWEIPGDKTYGDVGAVDPAKIAPSYDPLTVGTLIGSGPFACVSVFTADFGKVGTGCGANADQSRAGGASTVGGTVLLQAYDFTTIPGTTDAKLQYMRSYSSAWGTGSSGNIATSGHSGFFQEFRWADQGKTGTVDINDLAAVSANCNGVTVTSSSSACIYWLQASFRNNGSMIGSNADCTSNAEKFTGECTINQETQTVLLHFDDSMVSPFSFSPSGTNGLENIVTYP